MRHLVHRNFPQWNLELELCRTRTLNEETFMRNLEIQGFNRVPQTIPKLNLKNPKPRKLQQIFWKLQAPSVQVQRRHQVKNNKQRRECRRRLRASGDPKVGPHIIGTSKWK